MSEWWEHGKKTRKLARRHRSVSIVTTGDEGGDNVRSVQRDATFEFQTPAPTIKDLGRPVGIEGTGDYVPQESCPKCGAPLGTTLEVQAFRILKDIGLRFAEQQDTDRVAAFENYAKDLARNIAILSMSRSMSLEGISRTIAQIHSMIGAPKKKTETKEEKPLEALAQWLNGEGVPGFPEVAEVPPQPPPPEEEPEEDEDGESPAAGDELESPDVVEEPESDAAVGEGTAVPEPSS